MNGFINLIKPEGMSSAYAITCIKKKFHIPCGHMGTLDPMASGVLPVGVGKASRLFDYLLDKEKKYIANFKFGYTTDTIDITGNETERCNVLPTKEQILAVLPSFIGEIDQIPPKFSAKCISGKRGYELARKGIDFELPAKKVTILDIKMLDQISENEFSFEIDCKGGTYIRSLARDIAFKCNSLGVMSSLCRVKSGVFSIDNGVSIEDFRACENAEKYLIASDKVISFPEIHLDNERATKILNGVFENIGLTDGTYKVYNEQEFWGVGVSENGVLKIKSYVR